MNKDIFLLSCYCDNDLKLNSLRRYISFIKENNFDCALISPLTLPIDVQESVNFYFKISENPVLEWPEHAYLFWTDININNESYRLSKTIPDYGWTGLYHVKRLGEFLKNYDYQKFIFSVYDTILEDIHLNEINNSNTIIFPSKRRDIIWPVGLHLFSVHKNDLNEIIKRIKKEIYIKQYGDAFKFLEEFIVKPLQIKKSSLYVEDEIEHINETIYNIITNSEIEGVKYFISSDYDQKKTIKIVFYDTNKKIQIKCNGVVIFDGIINKNFIFDTKLFKNDINNMIIIVDNKNYDIIENIKKVKNSDIEKL